MLVWKIYYLQDARVHMVHETSCPEWSHGKKVSQHSGCSLHCPMLTVDWTGVGKKCTGPHEKHFKTICSNWVWPRSDEAQCTECNCPFDVLTITEKRINITDVGAHLDQLSPPPPFPLTSSAPGSLARNIEEGISVAPRTSVPCRRLENTTFYVKKRKRQQYLGT